MTFFNYNLMLSRQANIGLVDDHVLFRTALQLYLSEQQNLTISLQASDIFELLEKLKNTSVDILVMDIFLPKLNGNDALTMIRAEHPGMKIVALSMSTDMNLINELLVKGIHGYISKADEPEELVKAIQAVSENRIYRNKLLTEALYWNTQNNIKPASAASQVRLSDREKKLLQLIWEEKSNKEIADILFLGTRSVEKIRQDLKDKVGVKSTVGLLKYAIDNRLVLLEGQVNHWQHTN